jgi:hypothetical protein
MSYCRKCGAKLDDDARFCPKCGTPVPTIAVAIKSTAPKRKPVYILPVVILIAALVSAVVIGVLLVSPIYPVHFNQTNQVPATGMDSVFLDFQVDFAQVNIIFEDLPDKMAVLNVTADGGIGIFDDPNRAINVTFDHIATNNSVSIFARVYQNSLLSILHNLDVKCDMYIDPSANVTLEVRSNIGNIVVDEDTKVTLKRIDLETSTGSIDVNLYGGAVASGSISLRTPTGRVQFKMDEADVADNISVNLQSTTGAVNADFTAANRLDGNITVNALTTTGSIKLDMSIDGDVGARIESATNLGTITADVKRFSGTQSPIKSNNYPAGSNFLVNLRTETGGIDINANYGASSSLN